MKEKDPSAELKRRIRDLEQELSEFREKLEELYVPLVESIGEAIFVVDRECRYLFVTDYMAVRLKRPIAEIIGNKYADYHGPETTRIFQAKIAQVFDSGAPVQDEHLSTTKGRHVLRYFYPIKTPQPDGEVRKVVVVVQDITARKKIEETLRQSEERYRAIIENIEDGYYEVDLAGNFTFLNEATLMIFGSSRTEIMSANISNFVDKENNYKIKEIWKNVYAAGNTSLLCDWEIIRKGGEMRQVESSISLIRNTEGKCLGFRGIIRDVTEKKKTEETIRRMAYHDFLTGLPNRLLLSDRLNVALAQVKRQKEKIALMTLDLNRFKDINDTLGHYMGDILLQEVGKRLVELIRESDTAARLGGDEFTLLLHDIMDENAAAAIAMKIQEAFKKPFPCEGHQLSATPSIGIAICPDHGSDMLTLMKHADQAMYLAKGESGGYCIYGRTPAFMGVNSGNGN